MTIQLFDCEIYSSISSDPCMGELVEMYVDELPERIETLESLLADSNWPELKRMTHQIKASAPGYGFESVGLVAAAAELSIMEEQPVNDRQERIKDLIGQLKWIRFEKS